ncbi:MAG TPA: hypothetical protein VEJ46_09710 [Candidatus Acidoferrum sp.]|nr:hypothetical protein [Candidatus Acidoferrum sp.]
MKKLAVICGLVALFVVPAIAQDQPQSDQNQAPPEQTEPVKPKRTFVTPKYEISAGYAHRSYYSTDGTTLGMNGWYGSFEDNFHSWIGLIGEVAGTGKNQGIVQGVNLGKTNIYTFMVGPEVYPLRHRKLTPFGHFLYGAGYYRNTVPAISGFGAAATNIVVRAWQGGGGLDLNITHQWALRLIQFDVASSNFYPTTTSFVNSTMKRVSVGLVFHIGQR